MSHEFSEYRDRARRWEGDPRQAYEPEVLEVICLLETISQSLAVIASASEHMVPSAILADLARAIDASDAERAEREKPPQGRITLSCECEHISHAASEGEGGGCAGRGEVRRVTDRGSYRVCGACAIAGHMSEVPDA